jgi:hypothetical protein
VVCRVYATKLIVIVTCYFCSIEFTAARRAFPLLHDLKLPRDVNILKQIDADKPKYKAGKVNYMQNGGRKSIKK